MTDMALAAPLLPARPTRLRRFFRWLAGDLRAALALLVVNAQSIAALEAPDPLTLRVRTRTVAPLTPNDLSNIFIVSKRWVYQS